MLPRRRLRCTVLTVAIAGGGWFTNDAFADAFTFGDFVTYSQEHWGGPEAGPLLLANFDAVYSGRMEVGIPGSGPLDRSIVFSDAVALVAFLPQFGPSSFLNTDYINPTSATGAGRLAGSILALHLNIDFSDAGLLGNANVRFGDLVLNFAGTTAPLLDGMTVRQFAALGDEALAHTPPLYDWAVIGGVADFLNGMFEEGFPTANARLFLEFPPDTTAPVPEPASLLLVGSGAASLLARARRRGTHGSPQ